MTCAYCRRWTAKTREQLENRRRLMRESPDVMAHRCPMCESDDWATTDECIQHLPESARRVIKMNVLIAAVIVWIVVCIPLWLWMRSR